MEAIRYMQISSDAPQFRVAASSLDTNEVPPDPSPLLVALAQAFLPPDVSGASRRAYEDYLVKTCDLTDIGSTPSLVLAVARRVTKEQHPNSSKEEQSNEAKYLFIDWVNRLKDISLRHAALIEPLRNKLSDNQFNELGVAKWSEQILVYEQPGGVLADFVSALAPISREPRVRERTRGPAMHSLEMQQAGKVRLDDGNGPEQWDGAVSTGDMYSASAWPKAARSSQPPITFVGAIMGDPSLVLPEFASLANDPKSIFFLAPFTITADKMDPAWVQLYGCADLGPPPNTNGAERPWMQVELICAAAGLTIPPEFFTVGQGTRHVGGDSCFACRTLGSMMGYECKWYVHPADKAAPPGAARKPFGRQHMYLHQVLKCAYTLAFLHRLVRSDRDSGRGEVNAHLFQQRA
jgi:hypothetical protein